MTRAAHARACLLAAGAAVLAAGTLAVGAPVTGATAAGPRAAGSPLGVFARDITAQDGVPTGRYTLSLVDTRGRVVAAANAATRTDLELGSGQGQGGGAAALPLPLVSISRSRAYYVDGNSLVKSLMPGGAIATITRVPGGPSARVAIAVSPDDRRLAVGVLTYANPYHYSPTDLGVRTRVYAEDLAGGGHHVELFSSTRVLEWPVGWHNGALVLAVSDASATQQGSPNPYFALNGYHLASAATGRRLAVLCPSNATGTDGYALGPLVPAGALCLRGKALYVASWAGTSRLFARAAVNPFPGGAALAPDGGRVAASIAGAARLVVLGADGRRTAIPVPGTATVLGWIDATHVAADPGLPAGRPVVVDVRAGTVTPIGPVPWGATFYGSLPGGLGAGS